VRFVRPAVVLAASLLGCTPKARGGERPEATTGSTVAADAAVARVDDAAPDASDEAERAARLDLARTALDGGRWEGGDLYAATIRTSVMSEPAWPDDPDAGPVDPPSTAYRLGYLRHGSHVPYFPEPLVNDECPEGWYELLAGGFVCGKYTSPDPKAPSVKFAANPPNLSEAMPYKYGYAVVPSTPVYRRVLSLVDREKFEPELVPPPPSAPDASVSPSGEETDNSAASAAVPGSSTPGTVEEPTADRPPTKGRRPVKDAGTVTVKLGDLKGRGVLVRRMMKGFYVALDRSFNAAHARWWRTAEGFAIPFEKIALQGWSPDFHGSWVKPLLAENADGGDLPEGNGTAALVNTAYAARYVPNAKGKLGYTTPLPKWTALELVGEPDTSDGVSMQRTTSGFWVRTVDLMIATPQPPSDLGEGEKWIDVDLGRQLLVAFEGTHPVYATRVSSGRRYPWDPTHDHPTPTGTFRIYEKHVSTTMDGDVASDGPYSIEDVPWVMYFQGSYALHGAFWHNLFGSTRSHGCVNLSPIDARELFFWTEPTLPTGWHGVFQTAAQKGTRVVIHEPPQKNAGAGAHARP
jgi:lipoprotein-anchoring transpeptidase ErfK/SrfK